MALRLPACPSFAPAARPDTPSDLENFTCARGLRVSRQQRPVDEVANLSALIEGKWVRGHTGAQLGCRNLKLRRLREGRFKASKLTPLFC